MKRVSDNKRAPSIVIETRSGKTRLGFSTKIFLERYWQKRPLLIRQAFADFQSPIAANDLAGAACDEMAIARLVTHDPKRDSWSLQQGPFDAKALARFPKSHATLLVQDCDKFFDEVGQLLAHFRFIPSWRLDDIMISYATDQGSVGAHVDQYDVFLLQAHGRRRWTIDCSPRPDLAYREDVDLKLLKKFSPTHEWVLEPGDMLYLPPGVPHHGVAQGECMTFSIGMRAPAVSELLLDYVDHAAEKLDEGLRYQDPDLCPALQAAQIPQTTFDKARKLLIEGMTQDPDSIAEWFTGFITRYRSNQQAAPARKPLTGAQLKKALANGQTLHRNPWSRYAYRRRGGTAIAYFAGERFALSLRVARLLQNLCTIAHNDASEFSSPEYGMLAQVRNAGHWVLSHE